VSGGGNTGEFGGFGGGFFLGRGAGWDMRLAWLVWTFSILLPLSTASQDVPPGEPVSLITVECQKVGSVCSINNLVRYHFQDGEFAYKEVVFTSPVKSVRFDLGRNHILDDRYIVTNWADVIDLRGGVLLHHGEGDYLGVEGTRIMERSRKTTADGIFSFDLATGKVESLPAESPWGLPGQLSPGRTHSMAGSFEGEIWLHQAGGKKVLLGSGFNVQLSEISSSSPDPPILWLDENRALTQKGNGVIVLLDIQGKTEPVVTIPAGEPALSNPILERNADGEIIYSGEDLFVIDLGKRTYRHSPWVALGRGFTVEDLPDPAYGYIVRYGDQEIGRLWGSVHMAVTSEGYFAVQYGPSFSNFGYTKGIRVWSQENCRWTTIDTEWVVSLLGWIPD
jgi:hypothetical protein